MPQLQPWQILRTQVVADCSPWFRVVADDLRLPDGQRVEHFYRIEAPDFVMIFPLREDGHLLALRGYKHGPRRVMLQLPAGYMDHPDESPLECAQRELLEETGHVARDWRFLGRLSMDGNRGNGNAYMFLARDVQSVAPPDSGDLETLLVTWLSMEELRQEWRAGEFDNAAATALIGLALDALRHDGDADCNNDAISPITP